MLSADDGIVGPAEGYGEHQVGASPSNDDPVLGFGEAAVTPVTGARGTAFLADVYGIHCGTPPERAPRLILQIQYSVLPVYAFHYRPVAARLPAGSDRYMFRLMAR